MVRDDADDWVKHSTLVVVTGAGRIKGITGLRHT